MVHSAALATMCYLHTPVAVWPYNGKNTQQLPILNIAIRVLRMPN